MKVSHSADCQLYAQLWKLLQNWDLTAHVEEIPTQLNKMFCLAKHAPLGLNYLMRVIASGDRASLQ